MEKGYYWVKDEKRWVISETDGAGTWWICGDDCCLIDGYFEKIGRRIKEPKG
jgi:hypothetical protein